MYPVIFRIGTFELRSWGVFVLIGLILGILYISKRAQKHGINPERIWDLGFWAGLFGIIGSRIFYILYHWSYFSAHPSEMVKIWEGGAVFFGGFLSGLVAAIIYLLKNKKELPFWIIGDYASEALALGMFFGRWGCFFNGCCFGKETHLPWGVVFPPGSPAFEIMDSLHIHPSQLYESFANLILFFVLIVLEKKKPFDGFIMLLYFFTASLIRFLVDFTRYYEPENVYILTVNQWISAAMMVGSVIALVVLYKRSAKKK